ncbi:MAG TPA: hypothetical protein VHT97_15195 [Acidimicrobiales bacterium]|jgi:hypothetical protein|nr:hypothetical protein [Acidimicrobiales bacterium]
MPIDTEHRHTPPMPRPAAARHALAEPVDLGDPDALKRAVAMHQAGKAVFAIPFNAPGDGALTWLNPADAPEAASDG